MRIEKGKFLLVTLLILVAAGCRKAYLPPETSSPNNFLVVEGVINSGPDSTFIKISRTVNLASKVTVKPELNATVVVQGDQNTSYPLTQKGNGTYVCAGLNLDNAHKYRLSIKTANNKQYLSDYIPVLNSPPIDSVSFDTRGTVFGTGLNVYVSTHDPSNKVKYYRWEYQETWIFHANFASHFKSNGDTVLVRDPLTDNITFCWQSDSSSTIVLGSSARLTQNVIFNNPIISIPSTSEKVSREYSILVKQYAVTPEAYIFYSNLKKNTEQLGSIFDALPTENEGNIHCITNPAEFVVGYMSVGSTSSQRIFVDTHQLPEWETIPFYTNCELAFGVDAPCCYYVWPPGPPDQVAAYIDYNTNNNPEPLIPIDAIRIMPGQPPIGYTAAIRKCVDCTLRGTNKMPGFWK